MPGAKIIENKMNNFTISNDEFIVNKVENIINHIITFNDLVNFLLFNNDTKIKNIINFKKGIRENNNFVGMPTSLYLIFCLIDIS